MDFILSVTQTANLQKETAENRLVVERAEEFYEVAFWFVTAFDIKRMPHRFDDITVLGHVEMRGVYLILLIFFYSGHFVITISGR